MFPDETECDCGCSDDAHWRASVVAEGDQAGVTGGAVLSTGYWCADCDVFEAEVPGV